MHKLLMGVNPGKFAKTEYYTNEYAESAGFTSADLVINILMKILTETDAATKFAHMTRYDRLPESVRHWTKKIAAGVTAHCVWYLEKRYLFGPAK